MVLLATTSLAVVGRGLVALDEHQAILTTNKEKDGEAAYAAVKAHNIENKLFKHRHLFP